MTVPATMCVACRHWHGDETCEAYPVRIPPEILLGKQDHWQRYRGDQGIQFEPVRKGERDGSV
jgi:hypothetical protein